ncbi:MAG: pantoate--beta-alanine ligase [Candidatus Omnitrophota bacterium]
MKVIRSPKEMQGYCGSVKRAGRTIGFVPTMGCLHDGHISLVRRSVNENDVTVVSIFVNPTQFSQGEDFGRYPRDFRRDEVLLKKAGADAVFYPTSRRMYPRPFGTYVNVNGLTDGLCGKTRRGHFKGVTTIVAKLFNITKPDVSYFGQKDAQQALAIKKMVEDLNMDVRVKVLPIVREPDGLAMSSRNAYLRENERLDAVILYKSLKEAKRLVGRGRRDPSGIRAAIKEMILSKKSATKVDYIEVVDSTTLKPVKRIKGTVLIALAVWFGKTRLIDNIIVKG